MTRSNSRIALLLGTALLAGCGGPRGETVPFEVVGGVSGACLPLPTRGVFRSADAVARTMEDRPECRGGTWSADFDREAILVYTMGMPRGGSHTVRIEAVAREGVDGRVVYVTTISPKRGCAVTANISYPIAAARVEAFRGPVRFVVRHRHRRC